MAKSARVALCTMALTASSTRYPRANSRSAKRRHLHRPGFLIRSRRPRGQHPRFRLTGDNIARSLHLDIGGPDHLAPLLGIVGDELAEVGR